MNCKYPLVALLQGGIFDRSDNMRTEYGHLGTPQELMLYDILQELKKINQNTAPKKRTPVKKEVKKDG
jgi:hypothetical protein